MVVWRRSRLRRDVVYPGRQLRRLRCRFLSGVEVRLVSSVHLVSTAQLTRVRARLGVVDFRRGECT